MTAGLVGLAVLLLRPGAGSLSLVSASTPRKKKCRRGEILGKGR